MLPSHTSSEFQKHPRRAAAVQQQQYNTSEPHKGLYLYSYIYTNTYIYTRYIIECLCSPFSTCDTLYMYWYVTRSLGCLWFGDDAVIHTPLIAWAKQPGYVSCFWRSPRLAVEPDQMRGVENLNSEVRKSGIIASRSVYLVYGEAPVSQIHCIPTAVSGRSAHTENK